MSMSVLPILAKTTANAQMKSMVSRKYNVINSVTPNPGKQTFLNIENLWVYFSNISIFLDKVMLPTVHGDILCL